jgi:haloalkane dehalogenase
VTATLSAPTDERRASAARELVRPFTGEYPFEGRWVDVGGASLHVLDEGPSDAPPVLFVHGNPSWSFLWRRLVRSLSGTHRCVALDHMGCGLSDKPEPYPYRLEQHVENLERVVDALGLDRITLVVHDWGGAIGMGFARRHPDRVARLVISNTAAFSGGRIPLRISVCRLPLFGPLALRGFGGFVRAALTMAVERPLSPAARAAYLAPCSDWSSRAAQLAFVRDIPMAPSHPSRAELDATADALQGFRDRPTLLLWGMKDWCFTPAFLDEWRRRMPEAEVAELPDAGHWLYEDEPERTTELVRDFLDRTEV